MLLRCVRGHIFDGYEPHTGLSWLKLQQFRCWGWDDMCLIIILESSGE